jgi:hypothetical protein
MTNTRSKRLAGVAAGLLAGLLVLSPVIAADDSATLEGLVPVKAKRMAAAYLLPGANFQPYTKVMLDTPEAAFKKNWLRDYNRDVGDLAMRLSEKDAEAALEKVRTGFREVLAKAYTDAGYPVVTSPGPDVLRIRTAVVNLTVNAPDLKMGARVRTAAQEAGELTLVLEARDSQNNALLGRAFDRQIAGDNNRANIRNSVTNRTDFGLVFKLWAKESVAALGELKTMGAINVAVLRK